MLRVDWLLVFLLLVLGSCSVAVLGSAAHCIYTGNPTDCPRLFVDGKCESGTLGCGGRPPEPRPPEVAR